MLVPPLPEGLPPAAAALSAQPLTDLDAAGIAALRAALDGFLAGALRLSVRAGPLPESRDPALLGVAAAALAEAWSVEIGAEAGAAPEAALDRFVADCGGEALAWLRVEADAPGDSAGDPAGVARLAAFAADGLAQFRASDPAREPGAPRCVVLGRQDVSGALLVIAEVGARTVLLLVPPARLAPVTAAWRNLIR
jgi:hypothetical protein